MKRIIVFLIIVLPIVSSWAQFYKDYPESTRKDLAEAYYLAGKEYTRLGFAQGDNYIKLAYEIYPLFNPTQINESEYLGRVKGLLHKKGTKEKNPPPSIAVRRLIEYRFIQFIGALGSNNVSGIDECLDNELFTGESTNSIPKEEVLSRLESVMTDARVAGIPLTRLYDFNTITIDRAIEGGGERYDLRIQIDDAASKSIPGFPAGVHVYGFKKDRDTFLVYSIKGLLKNEIGRNAEADIEQRIKQTFGSALDSFFSKDVESLTTHIGSNIVILPMHATLANQEVAITFTGYFKDDALDTKDLHSVDAFDSAASGVKQTYILSAKFPGRIYRLEPVLKTEYLDRMPFFAQYEEYYFALVEDVWVIVAVG